MPGPSGPIPGASPLPGFWLRHLSPHNAGQPRSSGTGTGTRLGTEAGGVGAAGAPEGGPLSAPARVHIEDEPIISLK